MSEIHVDFCQGGPCMLRGAQEVDDVFGEFPDAQVTYWGCLGNCNNGPNAILSDVPYEHLTPEKLKALLLKKKG